MKTLVRKLGSYWNPLRNFPFCFSWPGSRLALGLTEFPWAILLCSQVMKASVAGEHWFITLNKNLEGARGRVGSPMTRPLITISGIL